jgi:pimeloyl-ACP methyl ester carboxylesterase
MNARARTTGRSAPRTLDWRHLAVVFGALLLASACATPIGAVPGDRQSVYRALTSNVLSSGKLSATTQQVLLRLGLAKRLEDEPEAVLSELRGSGSDLSPDQLSALAELSFAYADESQKPEYYLAAAVYAYAFLLPGDTAQAPKPVDPRNRLAADLYNLGLTRGLKRPDGGRVVLEAGNRPLPFGTLELTTDPKEFLWGGYRMSRFVPVAEFEVRGLRNRYRQPGVGVPLAAELTPAVEGAAAEAARKRIPPRVRVPVTAFVRLENVEEGIETGMVRGRIELYPADEATTVQVGGLKVPLELEPTAALAYQLEGAPVWDSEIAGFLRAQRPLFGDGLGMLQPYQPGRIPVVFIHGTASSPARWAEMLNELENDPVLRERVQFWLFNYNTSNLIVVSAMQLRDALRNTVKDLDPDGRDPALYRMVLIGHSQGGLLARLMVTDSGTRFWDNVSKVPLSELKVTPQQHELLEGSLFFKPLPFVNRVIFIATPHRGSFRASGFVLDVIRWLVTLPVTLVRDLGDIAKQNPDAVVARDGLKRAPTAVDNMSGGHPFMKALAASPMAPDVKVNSIVAVQGEGPLTGLGDGVVRYDSAHLEGVESEKVVRSSHSTQGEPATIEEVRRILREQVTGK